MLHDPHHPEGVGGEKELKPVGWSDLPERLRMTLSSIPKDRWSDVLVSVCPSELMMDAANLLAVFARVWDKSKAAEDFRIDRLPGDEREKYRKEFEGNLKGIAGTTIRLGVRSRLYGELQLAKELLTRYAQEVWQSSWTKAMARSAHGEGVPGKTSRPAVPARDSKPQAPRPSVPSPKKLPLVVPDTSPAV